MASTIAAITAVVSTFAGLLGPIISAILLMNSLVKNADNFISAFATDALSKTDIMSFLTFLFKPDGATGEDLSLAISRAETLYSNFTQILMIIAFTLILFMFVMRLIALVASPDGTRDSLVQLFLRLIISVAAVYLGTAFMAEITGIIATITDYATFKTALEKLYYSNLSSTAIDYDAVEAGFESFVASNAIKDGALSSIGMTDAEFTGFLSTVLSFLVNIMIIIQEIKLVGEMIERWLNVCLLQFFAPLLGYTIMSPSSTDTYKTYVKLTMGQYILYILTAIWLNVFRALKLSFSDSGYTVLELFLLIGFAMVGVRFEQYMKDLRMDTVSSASPLFDSIKGGIVAAAAGVGSAVSFGKTGIRAVGTGATMAGAATGSAGLSAFGNGLMGNPTMSAGATLKSMMKNPAYHSQTRHGELDHVSPSLRNAAARCFGEKDFSTFGEFMGSLDAQGKKNVMSSVWQNNYQGAIDPDNGRLKGFNVDAESLTADRFGSLHGNALLTDADGNQYSTGFSISNDQVKGGMNIPITDSYGNSQYLNMAAPDDIVSSSSEELKGATPLSEAESFSLTPSSYGESFSAPEMAMGTTFEDLGITGYEHPINISKTVDGGYDVLSEDGSCYAHVSDGDISFARGRGIEYVEGSGYEMMTPDDFKSAVAPITAGNMDCIELQNDPVQVRENGVAQFSYTDIRDHKTYAFDVVNAASAKAAGAKGKTITHKGIKYRVCSAGVTDGSKHDS